MYNFHCSPTVANCIFLKNGAGKGGGMYNANGTSPTVIHCVFCGNGIVGGTRNGRGGGVANDLLSHPTFTGCTFINNATTGKGGGMFNDFGCDPKLVNCLFVGNEAKRGGAMVAGGRSAPTLINCTITRNVAHDQGGGDLQRHAPRRRRRAVSRVDELHPVWQHHALRAQGGQQLA